MLGFHVKIMINIVVLAMQCLKSHVSEPNSEMPAFQENFLTLSTMAICIG
jgi:hypothetical protein